VHYLFVALLAGLVDAALPAATIWPVLLGMGMGLTLLFAFGLPPVLQLAQVPPLRVIRRDVGNLRPASLGVLSVGVLGFAALLLAASSDLKLGLIAVGGFWWRGAGVRGAELGRSQDSAPQRQRDHGAALLVLATRQVSARRPTPWCRSARWPWACLPWCCWCCCAPI